MSRRPIPRISRVGVDVGGTFTDIVLIDPSGAIQVRKLPSTPEDFSRGVTDGVRHVLDRHDVDPGSVRDVVHGSTVATNAILERKGARTGLLTTEGFRDVLEIRRLRMPGLYDMTWQKPRAARRRIAAPRSRRAGRHRRRGRRRRSTSRRSGRGPGARRRWRRVRRGLPDPLVREHDPRARDRRAARRRAPGPGSRCRTDVLPDIREYERTSTTVINAYVQPIVAYYLGALSQPARATTGSTAPLLIMQSNGGIIGRCGRCGTAGLHRRIRACGRRDAAAELARRLGIDEVISFDMGGTTAKASLVEDGRPHFTAEFEVAAGISAAAGCRAAAGMP